MELIAADTLQQISVLNLGTATIFRVFLPYLPSGAAAPCLPDQATTDTVEAAWPAAGLIDTQLS